jgi:hypothetical protein
MPTGVYKRTDIYRKKLSLALKGKKKQPFSASHKAKISAALKGRKLSMETRAKMKGRKAWNAGRKFPEYSGENHGQWKGNYVGYGGIHQWMSKTFGLPQKCEMCDTTEIPKGKSNWFNWANLSGKYRRERLDWKRVCQLCHRKLDAHTQVRGEKQHLAKLDTEKIEVIRWAHKQGIQGSQLSRMFGVTHSCISSILHNKTWRHVKN